MRLWNEEDLGLQSWSLQDPASRHPGAIILVQEPRLPFTVTSKIFPLQAPLEPSITTALGHVQKFSVSLSGCLQQIFVLSQRALSPIKNPTTQCFLIPSCYKIWSKRLKGSFHSPWWVLGHSLSSSTPITLLQRRSVGGEAGVMERPPTNVFVLHNNAVNRTVSLCKRLHSSP